MLLRKHFEQDIRVFSYKYKGYSNPNQDDKKLEGQALYDDMQKNSYKYRERLPPMIIEKAEALVKKVPSHTK
jgi:hypothetical protein